MARSGFKMKGYTYPGASPMEKDDKLVKTKGRGKNTDYIKSDYDILVTPEVKNLIDAGAPQSVIDAYALKQKKEQEKT